MLDFDADSAFLGLTERIVARTTAVAVIGQGYVGLTLAASLAADGFVVTGVDTDASKVDALSSGRLVVPGVRETTFREAFESGRLTFSSRADSVAGSGVVCICVPTPIRDHAPDLSYVEAAGRDVARFLQRGTLVTLESTTYPGTTDDLLRALLDESGLRLGQDYLLAFSPERIDPGNDTFHMRNTPRLVGGCTPDSTAVAVTFYEQIVDKVVAVSSARVAETAKLLENTFRHVNIGLVNELAIACHELGIDVWEVIEAAATKPYGFMPFFPGPGVGGHCIPLDPTYLAWQIRRESGRRFGILEAAQDINEDMPNYVVSRVTSILNDLGKSLRGSRVLILGVSYKPDVADVRESPALRTMAMLAKRGAVVSFHDFFVPEVEIRGERYRAVELEDGVRTSDCIVILTPHSGYDFAAIAETGVAILDTRNAIGMTSGLPNVTPL